MPHLPSSSGSEPHGTAAANDATSADRAGSATTRLIEGQNQVLERIARGEPLQPTLDLLLRIVEAQFTDVLCSILILDPDGVHLRHISAPSLPASFTSAFDGEVIGPHAGSSGTPAYRREPVIVEDVAADPLWADFRDIAARHGLRACWSTPILDEHGRVLGVLAMYFRRPARPDRQHWELTELATHTAAIAIEKNREAEERGRIEHDARRRQLQLEEAQRIAHLGSYEWDVSKDTVWWSPELSRILGVEPGALRPALEGFLARVHADDRLAARATLQKAMRDRTPFEIEGRVVRPDGSIRLLHARNAWILEQNEPVKLVGTAQDVTDQRAAERELRESEERFQLVARATNDVIWDWNVETGYVWWNQGITTLFGYAPDEVVHDVRWSWDRVHPDDVARWRAALDSSMERRDTFITAEYRFRRADGSFADVLDRGYIVYDSRGKALRVIGTIADVSERKRAVDLLERHVASRTAELNAKNAQLEGEIRERNRVSELLRQRNEELKAFAYTVSHDLKTPLRGLSGYTEELVRNLAGRLQERDRFCLNQILAAAHRLDRLIEDLLAYSRLDAETPTQTAVDVAALVDTMLRDRSATIRDQHVELVVRLDVHTLHVWQRGLTQVLANLVDNALKYTRKTAQPRVEIVSERRPTGVLITVRDNGIGFDMRYHDRIFGLFNRLVRQEDFEGTGAGLAIAKRVVEKMNGRLWAESAPGQGSTFFVELPAEEGQGE